MADVIDKAIIARCDQKLLAIITVCKQLADQGAHYLWGANGEKPGQGAVRLKPFQSTGQVSFCAAWSSSTYTCVGRFRTPGFKGVAPHPKVDNQAAVQKFFDRKPRLTEASQIGWGSELTPRYVSGYDADDHAAPKDGRDNLNGKIVFGEGCDDTQHFDCGSLVRYAVALTCFSDITGVSTIAAGAPKKNIWGEQMGRLVKTGEYVLPADIFIYPGHICFANDFCTTYGPGRHFPVVQAQDAAHGLNYDQRRGDQTACIRLSPSTLLGQPIAGQYPSTA